MNCKFLVSVCAAAFAASASFAVQPAPFVLAEDGLARAAVVVPRDALPGVKYAANELAEYLGRIAGTHFMVADRPVKGFKSILVGTPYKAGHPEEICVRVKDVDTLEVTGDRSRGTLYAAYDLLETLGVVFCTTDYEYVPTTNRLEIAGDYAKVDWPFMYAMRHAQSESTWWAGLGYPSKLRWHVARNVAEKAGCPDLGEDYEHDRNHAVTTRWVSQKKYAKDHPDWYAYVRPTDSRNFNWVCISNEEMWKQLLKDIGDHLEANPGLREVSVAIGDAAHFCDCDACTKLVREYPDPDGSEVPSVQCYLLANRVARHFGKKYPNVRFNMLPYCSRGREPASPKLKLEPNVGGCVAELWRNHGLPADCNERSAVSLVQFGRNVTNPANGTYVWDYLANFRDWSQPFPNLYIIPQTMRYYRRQNVAGMYTQHQFSNFGDLSSLKLWLQAKLLWNPDADADALIDTYLKACYGPAAKHMREYIDVMEHARLRQRWTWYGCYTRDTSHFLTGEDCVRLLRAVQNARKAIGGDKARLPVLLRAQIPALHLALWRYRDMIEPAKRMKFALPPIDEIWRQRNAILDNPLLPGARWWQEGTDYYKAHMKEILAADIQPTNYVPSRAVLHVAAKDLTGGSRMTRQRDPDGTEFCQLKVSLAGEPDDVWMTPRFAEIGYTCALEDTGDWYVFATVRLGTTVDGDPSSAYMGIYQPWYPNGVKLNGNSEVANQAIVGRLADAGKWRTICLGRRRLLLGTRVWIMPGILHPVDYIDVRDFTFVHPDLVEKGAAAEAAK